MLLTNQAPPNGVCSAQSYGSYGEAVSLQRIGEVCTSNDYEYHNVIPY